MPGRRSKTKVATVDELRERSTELVEVDDRKYLLYFDGEEIRGYRNVCPHQYGPVAEGLVHAGADGRTKVTCPWHGWEYDLATGENPVESIERHLPRIDVTVEDGDVYV